MSARAARILVAVFFLGYTVFLTWPGVLPFNRIRPFILGLPFSMAWVGLWVALSGVVLAILHRAEAVDEEGVRPTPGQER